MSRSRGVMGKLVLALVAVLWMTPAAVASSTILVGAPESVNSFYGMCCHDPDSFADRTDAAQFTLSANVFVTTIDVAVLGHGVFPPGAVGNAIYEFSLQNALTGAVTRFATWTFTVTDPGQRRLSMALNVVLPAGTYYLLNHVNSASTLRIPGWFVSDGQYSTAAGGVADGLWVLNCCFPGGGSAPWQFLTGPQPPSGFDFVAPVFAVNGFVLAASTDAIRGLIDAISGSSGLALSPGQISSLTDKLNNVLASIQAGQNKQAANQLKAFVNSVEASLNTGRMDTATANALIAAANAIIALL